MPFCIQLWLRTYDVFGSVPVKWVYCCQLVACNPHPTSPTPLQSFGHTLLLSLLWRFQRSAYLLSPHCPSFEPMCTRDRCRGCSCDSSQTIFALLALSLFFSTTLASQSMRNVFACLPINSRAVPLSMRAIPVT